jgi:hypothetical protein
MSSRAEGEGPAVLHQSESEPSSVFLLPAKRGEGGRRACPVLDKGPEGGRYSPNPTTTVIPSRRRGTCCSSPDRIRANSVFLLPAKRGEGGRRPDEGCSSRNSTATVIPSRRRGTCCSSPDSITAHIVFLLPAKRVEGGRRACPVLDTGPDEVCCSHDPTTPVIPSRRRGTCCCFKPPTLLFPTYQPRHTFASGNINGSTQGSTTWQRPPSPRFAAPS